MTKKPMTWIDVVKEQLAKLRKEGKSPSIGDVTPAARKEWNEIKSGKHPLYSQGSSKGKKRSSSNKQSKQGKQGKNKTQKMRLSSNNNAGEAMDHRKCIEQMLAKVHLCKKDVGKIQKYLKTMKMQKGGVQKGGDCGCSQSGGSGSCSSCQAGGKGKKGRRTMKLKKGKKVKKGGGAHEEDTENDTEADDTKAEEKDSFVSAIDEETGEYGSGEAQKVAITSDED
jgi:hypothetical protein